MPPYPTRHGPAWPDHDGLFCGCDRDGRRCRKPDTGLCCSRYVLPCAGTCRAAPANERDPGYDGQRRSRIRAKVRAPEGGAAGDVPARPRRPGLRPIPHHEDEGGRDRGVPRPRPTAAGEDGAGGGYRRGARTARSGTRRHDQEAEGAEGSRRRQSQGARASHTVAGRRHGRGGRGGRVPASRQLLRALLRRGRLSAAAAIPVAAARLT